MTDFVEVKTKAAAEKAIKVGRNIKIIAGTFVLTLSGVSPEIVIEGSAAPHLILELGAQPTIENWESCQPRIENWESCQPRIVNRESCQPRIENWESCQPRIENWESCQPTIVNRGSCQPRIVNRGSCQPRIENWESCQPRIENWESCQPRIVNRESCQPTIVNRGSCQPRIDLHGYVMAQIRGAISGGYIRADATVTVNLWNGAECEGGCQIVVNLSTNQDWCGYYGVPISKDGTIILYKGVSGDYRSGYGGDYTPGSMPEADQWDGGKVECSHGLHWSPTPRHTREFAPGVKRWIAAPHKLEDIVVHWGGDYPQKAMTRATAGPVFEVDIDGNPVARDIKA
jgi:hypothetical protein